MERPKTPNPIPNPTGEESRQKEPELQIVQTYKDDAFFQKVIAENRTEKGKHIAIIGEPGAGKTTLLGELAERLPKNSPDFPICIRLADLRESTIEDYLLNNWLKKALQFIDADAENVTPEIGKALKQLFSQGKVWLLLDGVDEMAAESPVQALAKIRDQLTDWVGKARVVLTCRLNVWDAAISNTLTNFETYKTLEFEPDDVDEFIHQWFEQASQDEKRRNSDNETSWHSQGKRLQQQLKAPGKERIRELVRNPLRLSMLCQSWCVAERDLPSTKAALYEQFTTYFFDWKKEEFQQKQRVLKETDKKQIQQALAKLALAAMESANRFRIEQEFAIGQMEEQWFDLADELGWLVLVDRDTRTKKPVYAFYHPTFQEYFAACAITDWHYFLDHQIPPVSDRYRIFERQWREVILLWLGRGEIEAKQKQEFIDALVNFEDGCGKWNSQDDVDKGFYEYRAYFLAAAAIAEFQDYSQIDEVIGQIVRWGFYNGDRVISNAAREALEQTQLPKAIDALVQLLNSPNLDDDTGREVAESLGRIDPGNQKAIDALVQLLISPDHTHYSHSIVRASLKKIGQGNQKAIDTLIQLLYSIDLSNNTRSLLAVSLGMIGQGNQKAIDALLQLLNSANLDDYIRRDVAESLGKIDPGNQKAINALVQLLNSPDIYNYDRLRVAESLGKIDPNNQKTIDTLVQLLNSPNLNADTRIRAPRILQIIGQANKTVSDDLAQLLNSSHLDDDIRSNVAESLGKIDPGNQKAINTLVQLLNSPHLDNDIRRYVTESLGKIGQGNQNAIDTLVQLLNYPNINYISIIEVIRSLGKIGQGNQNAIDTLVQLLNYPNLRIFTRSNVAESLGKIDPGNQKAINTFVQLLNSPNRCDTYIYIWTESLKNIQIDKPLTIIKALIAKLNNFQEINYDCYNLIWHYAQNLPYPDFYQAWHQDTLPNSPTASLNLANLPQILAEAINDRPDLCSKVKLICIDTHQFIEPENSALEIYDMMLNQNCPESQNGYPDTMQKLKLYWNSLRRQSEIPLFFICYDSTALSPTPTGFSAPFLKALSKFDRAICVVCEKADISLPTFSPSQPNLIAKIVAWISEMMA
ncbi:HEAT repeat domain-containing protein [Microcoleus sp. bin38.metabat.b11b12b14.051]|uniref:NACHT C-terminal alpha/beta 1 domain-containing protein n=1 Tax=Microcoleus sp. bin38.metabat.b11b12b14.051 TaxID=2742709 RepID=UPI0025E1AF7E|nr:HEAT repeat domain-containing protein [Microcoleus sp. bin38.metabat.b11b12b14.051]